MIFKMAFRNIFRHKIRTFLTLIIIIVGVMVAILGEGLNRGLERQIIDTSIRTEIGINKLYQKGYYDEKEDNDSKDFLIENEKEIREILKNKKSAYRIYFNGSINNGVEELQINFYGVDRSEEDKIFNRSSYLLKGNFLKNKKNIVIGYELANLLNLKIGDSITIIARTKDNNINAYDLIIGGILKTENPFIDGKTAFIDINFAKEFIDIDKINDIVVNEELTKDEIKKLNDLGVRVVNYKEELSGLLDIVKIRRKAFGIISIVILLMAGVGIINTMLMVMLERRKEIGILMANGMRKKEILILFLYEGMMLGVFGSLIGFILGSIITLKLQQTGIPLPQDFNDGGFALPISQKFYVYYDFGISFIYFIVGVVVALFASFYPSNKATKLEPVEVIRNN
ncbi:putative ABC transport system permease protein [Hypnocyclicus thermotrophus]|uniref:ABC transport system permease protein n=1 Tax=Hypnocyclicus thermotrophus TaxID=1627895 RepID=A0AA46E0W3_9FUSO|nr:FtsX-like permease family protein [Hypnocyclicus thermotrophus]TDT72373.1 putative ABC transport system permease protein [Hypnocyclicus thermotrophus]